MIPTDPLSLTFAALADPTRRAILARLREGEATVSELAERSPLTIQAISKHQKALERAGLIARSRDRQRRPSALRVEPLAEAEAWLEEHRTAWETRLDQLDEHLRDLTRRPSDQEPHR